MLAEIDAAAPDELWCLGDLVGYGPHPEEVVARVRERAAIVLAGNHDLAVRGTVRLDEFGGDAGAAVRWTRGRVGDETLGYLTTLQSSAGRGGFGLHHGSPRDPVWEYVLDRWSAGAAFAAAPERHVLVGHSHIALRALTDGSGAIDLRQAAAEATVELDAPRSLLNPGSVGQPRDGDPRASWLVIDGESGRATFRRTNYDIARTQADMRAAGLPEGLAARLSYGL